MTDAPVTIDPLDEETCWRVTFGTGKGNVLDTVLTSGLTEVFRAAATAPRLKALCLEGRGPHFSFGASVQEHLPGAVAPMLRRFHDLLFALVDSGVFVTAVVRGQCLGGGLELATLCHRVVATRDAKLGQPEIALAVFAPAASIALAHRVGRPRAEDLCVSGRTVGAEEARAMGLVDELTDGDPMEAALAYVRQHLGPKSASSLRYAVRAVRAPLRAQLAADLPALERLYLDDLMATGDAVEGLQAFLDRRAPVWRHA